MQYDGNFSLFSTEEYDDDKILKSNPSIENYFEQYIMNNSSIEQSTSIEFTVNHGNTFSWQTNTNHSLGIKNSLDIEVPFGAQIGFEISGSFSQDRAEGKTETAERSTTFKIPIVIPAKKIIKVNTTIVKNTTTLPYTARGIYTTTDAGEAYCVLEGTFLQA